MAIPPVICGRRLRRTSLSARRLSQVPASHAQVQVQFDLGSTTATARNSRGSSPEGPDALRLKTALDHWAQRRQSQRASAGA
jgi:hypothetical protein